MRYSTWIGLAAAIALIISCFMPWIIVETNQLLITGVDATGTNFGKPGYANLLFTAFFIFFHLVPRVWAKRANLMVVALNLAWAIRNYLVLSTCRAGECPEKQWGLYLLVVAALIMLVTALFPNMKLPQHKTKKSA